MRFVVIVPPADPNLAHQLSEKPPLRDDTRFAAGKIAVFQYATVVIFLFLISGFLAVAGAESRILRRTGAAEPHQIACPFPAPRGRILDRDGRVIVDNHSSFSLLLTRESLKDEHLRPIAEGLDLDYNDLLRRVDRGSQRSPSTSRHPSEG